MGGHQGIPFAPTIRPSNVHIWNVNKRIIIIIIINIIIVVVVPIQLDTVRHTSGQVELISMTTKHTFLYSRSTLCLYVIIKLRVWSKYFTVHVLCSPIDVCDETNCKHGGICLYDADGFKGCTCQFDCDSSITR